LSVCLVFQKDRIEGIRANFLGAHPGSASWERILGAQASMPAGFPAMTD